MAIEFVVEDGSGKSDATSYVSEADADQFHENRGNAAWALLTSAQKQTALNRATAYIDSYFSWVFGRRSIETQALDWPRIGAYDEDEYYFAETTIPQQVKDACCVLALKASSEDIVTDSSRPIKAFTAGSVSVEFEEGTSTLNTYNEVMMLLRGFIHGFGSSVRLDLV